jgi:hypothetical protein
MHDWLDLLKADIIVTIRNLRLIDAILPVMILIWLLLWALPLTDAEREDKLVGSAYVMMLVAAAITLMLAIPGFLTKLMDAPMHLVFTGGIGLLASWRWYKFPKDQFNVIRTQTKKDE